MPLEEIIEQYAKDVYGNAKLARLEHDFIDGFAQMFKCPRALLRSEGKEVLLDCLRRSYPNIRRSKARMFIEGNMTEGDSHSLQIHHRRNCEMVLLFCDLVETLYANQYKSRSRLADKEYRREKNEEIKNAEIKNDVLAKAREAKAVKAEERKAEALLVEEGE